MIDPPRGYDALAAFTHEAMCDPRVGDRFHDMFAFWVYVVVVEPAAQAGADGPAVTVMEGGPPSTWREHVRRRTFASSTEFREHYAYKGIPGYWVVSGGRECDVADWVATNHAGG